MSPATFSPSTWTPDQVRDDGRGAGTWTPDQVRDDGRGAGTWTPGQARDDGRGARTWTPDQARGDGRGARTWTPDQARGDGLLKDPGFVRRLFRHSNPCACTSRGQGPLLQRCGRLSLWERLVAAMPGFFRLHSVIPAKAEPAPDSIRGIHVYRDETAEEFPEGDGIFPATFSRSKWTPGLRPG
jgi:hypothetical protein